MPHQMGKETNKAKVERLRIKSHKLLPPCLGLGQPPLPVTMVAHAKSNDEERNREAEWDGQGGEKKRSFRAVYNSQEIPPTNGLLYLSHCLTMACKSYGGGRMKDV